MNNFPTSEHLRTLIRAWYHHDSDWSPPVQDWDGFWTMARRHGLDGMAGALAVHGAQIPTPLQERAIHAYASNVLRYKRAEALCQTISRAAGDRRLSVVKGPALAAAYGDEGVRGFGDIDIIIPDAVSGFDLAHTCGLKIQHGLIETPTVFWKRVRNIGRIEASDAQQMTVEFTHGADKGNEPLHTLFTEWPGHFLLKADAQQPFPVPEDHAHIIFLLQHLAVHWCNRLVWLADFAVVMRRKRFDGAWLEEVAGRLEMRRFLHAVTLFCNTAIDADLPVLCHGKRGWKDGLFLAMLSDEAWARPAFSKYEGGRWSDWVKDPVLGALHLIYSSDLSHPSFSRKWQASKWTQDWLQYVIHPKGHAFYYLIIPIFPFLFLVMLLLVCVAFRRGPLGFLRLASQQAAEQEVKSMKMLNVGVSLLIGAGALLSAGCDFRQAVVTEVASTGRPTETGTRAANVLECLGTLHPVHVFTLRLNPNDVVESVHVKLGDALKQGDLLVTLSNPVLQGELVAARERILALKREALETHSLQWKKDAAAARLAELSQRLEAQEALREKVTGYNPQTQDRELVDEKNRVEREVKGYEGDIQQRMNMAEPTDELIGSLEQRIAEIENRLARLTVRAPHAGVVVRLERDPNPKDGLLLELHDRAGFIVRGMLWQNQLEHVKPGCEVAIIPDYASAKQWTGRISSIGLAPVIHAAVSFPQYPLDVALDDYDDTHMLRDGMTVMMRIRLDGEASQPE